MLKDTSRLIESIETSQNWLTADRSIASTRSISASTQRRWTMAIYGVYVIHLDYRKAFDTVPHARLISFVTEVHWNWRETYRELHNTIMTRVNVKGSFSQCKEVFRRVPQGSVLGPLLFLIYLNDIPGWMKTPIRMFVDDIKLESNKRPKRCRWYAAGPGPTSGLDWLKRAVPVQHNYGRIDGHIDGH